MSFNPEKQGIITGERVVALALAALAVVATLRVADRAEDLYDFLTPGLPDISLPESFENPPATIDVDTTQAIFTEISSQLVHQKTESVENVGFYYENKDQGWLSSNVAGASLDTTLFGNVTATVDFSTVAESDIQPTEDGRGLTIELPPAGLFITKIDEDRTDLELDHGWFNDAFGARESDDVVRVLAEQVITDTALENGLLESTQDEAGTSIKKLVGTILASQDIHIDPDDIKITFAAPDGSDGGQPDDNQSEEQHMLDPGAKV